MWNEVIKTIKKGESFLVTTHINPDGDAIGSELALFRFLRAEGKRVKILNSNPTPRNYEFLDSDRVIEVYTGVADPDPGRDVDAVFVLDISTSRRLGPLWELVSRTRARKICIDHHLGNDRFADLNVIDTGACATGELVYDLIMSVRGWLDYDLALPLYVSIMTDTGSFRFSNTTERTHVIVSHLISVGVNPRKVYEQIYENNSVGQMRLLARVLGSLQLTDDGRIAWIEVERSAFDDTGANPEELEGMIDYLRMIGGVEVCLLFLERERGGTKVSMRSKGDFDVNLFASRYGGGGHQHAAGAVLDVGLEEAVRRVVSDLSREMGVVEGIGGREIV